MPSLFSDIDEGSVPDRSAEFDHRAVRRRRPVDGKRRWLSFAVAFVGILVTVRALGATTEWELGTAAQDFVTLSSSVVIESLPFVFLGIVLSIVVQVWLPDNFLLRRLPKAAAPRRFVLSLLGVLFPVCECGNMPLARGLMLKGLSVSDSITFLLAAPILNPVTIITTYQAFGWDNGILVSRILGGLVIANLLGAMVSRNRNPERLLTRTFQATCDAQGHEHGTESKSRRSLRAFAEETSAMLPALFVGSALAGAIQVGVPREVLISLGSDPLVSVLALILLAFIISICSSVDAFFILSFGSTFMPGAIVAFLVFGPMIDIKMLSLMRTTYSTRLLIFLTAVVGVCSLLLGLAVNLLA